jgi:hypothetical protein
VFIYFSSLIPINFLPLFYLTFLFSLFIRKIYQEYLLNYVQNPYARISMNKDRTILREGYRIILFLLLLFYYLY